MTNSLKYLKIFLYFVLIFKFKTKSNIPIFYQCPKNYKNRFFLIHKTISHINLEFLWLVNKFLVTKIVQ